MRVVFITLMLCIISNHYLLGNISSIENNFTYSLIASNQDTTFNDSTSIFSETGIIRAKFKSPGKAMIYSAVLPGMGQIYMGKWKRGLILLGLEGIALGTWHYNNKLSKESERKYVTYAGDNWDFATWIHDYYKWYPNNTPNWFSGDDTTWQSIREVFVNYSDTLFCSDPPYCYTDIWDHSHNVEFKWDGKRISSNSEDFHVGQNGESSIFEVLCGDNASVFRECSKSIEEINDIMSEYKVYVIKDHHYYEGIQKYDMFFAGWVDNDSAIVVIKDNNDINITSDHQIIYRSFWTDYNRIKTLANRGGRFMLINRFVGMVDALFLAKKWNNEHGIQLSLNTYPDLRNRSGVGGLRLSIFWK